MSRFFPDVFTIPCHQCSDFFLNYVRRQQQKQWGKSAQEETVADPAKKASCIFKQRFLLPIFLFCIKTYFWESLKVFWARARFYSKAEFFIFYKWRGSSTYNESTVLKNSEEV